MLFVGLRPLREQLPSIEIEGLDCVIDLHNDAVLREFAYEFALAALRIVWTLKRPAWQQPAAPAPEDRPALGLAVLSMTDVRSLRIRGDLVAPAAAESITLEHYEYTPLAAGYGTIRFIFYGGAEVLVEAARCELTVTHL